MGDMGCIRQLGGRVSISSLWGLGVCGVAQVYFCCMLKVVVQGAGLGWVCQGGNGCHWAPKLYEVGVSGGEWCCSRVVTMLCCALLWGGARARAG
jgi:hypothetical protein